MPALADALRVAAGSPDLARRLTAAADAVGAPVATSRRVAVLQADGGAGATATVARTGSVLARRRGGGVLAVDAARGRATLGRHAGVGGPPPLEELAARATGVVRSRQARELFPRTRTGLAVLGDGSGGAARPPGLDAWRRPVDRVGRFFDVVLTDWGVRTDAELGGIVAAHHAAVVVARADRGPAERGLALAAALTVHVPALLVLVDLGGSGAAVTRPLRAAADVPVLAVPHVPALAAGRAAAARPGLAARAAYAGLAAALVQRATGGPA